MKCHGPGHLVAFLLLIIHVPLGAEGPAVEYFAPHNIYRFAAYLYEERDYLRAAGEFQRYLVFLDSIPANADSILYAIGLCYRLGGDIPRAVRCFDKIVGEYPQSPYADDAYYQTALAYSVIQRYGESTAFAESHLADIRAEHCATRMKQLIALNYIQQSEWAEASSFLEGLRVDRESDSLTLLLADWARKGQELPRKNRVLAGLFSAVIPGSGKVYCGRAADGLFSFLAVGLTGWQAYEGFRRDGTSSTRGWLFGSLSGIFHLGNVYGSAVAAQIQNEEQEKKLIDRVRASLSVHFQ